VWAALALKMPLYLMLAFIKIMARIKVSHLHRLMGLHAQEKISFSKIVEELNLIAEYNGINCKRCEKELTERSIYELETGLCHACFTSNA